MHSKRSTVSETLDHVFYHDTDEQRSQETDGEDALEEERSEVEDDSELNPDQETEREPDVVDHTDPNNLCPDITVDEGLVTLMSVPSTRLFSLVVVHFPVIRVRLLTSGMVGRPSPPAYSGGRNADNVYKPQSSVYSGVHVRTHAQTPAKRIKERIGNLGQMIEPRRGSR
ncbi:hypothetical protein DPEC_G00005050 [Dallia pectoralis]|uniref:Uncharacterized protein n=1 Tax=Dallia pectoralis TaxID=75939 RepID=A0ACC2HJZ9_DALPE|nr:hypothetical protein DPEC_G00005050 [Dallia pectoralis]